jgi:hypothetical protein
MKKIFILSMLISFEMICSCQKQDPAAEPKRTDIRNTTGVIGVASVKERTRSGNLIVRYRASWPTRSGKRGNASFSVGLYGEKRAFGLAVSTRRAGLRDFKIRSPARAR